MTINNKLNQVWTLLYEIRKERNAPFKGFNDDPISNTLLHAMYDIEEAHEDLQKELEIKSI